jgi:protein-tyrosine phosphatase
MGVWMQITAGSLTGRFGSRPKYWAEKMLAQGMVHILATDAHNTTSRPPLMSEALNIARAAVGMDEANNLVLVRPVNILDDVTAIDQPQILIASTEVKTAPSRWRRLFRSN